jgi:uncharacterized protein (DUF2062 family)
MAGCCANMAEAMDEKPRGWLRRHIPTRETIGQYRLLRPFARHLRQSALWRMHRRSVPRAVALGLAVGVIIPIMHMFVAALLAIPLRANIAVAAATTLLINPLTIPPMYYAAYRIGSWELRHDAAVINPADAERVSGELGRILFWIHEASGPIALGVLTLAAAAALAGYLVTAIAWRFWSHSKWYARRQERRAARP